MKNFIKIAALTFCLTVNIQAQKKQPNILFIAVDDMNDWVGYMGGHPQTITPNLDKLSKKGVAFMNAYCSAPGCSPSRNALLYGVEPFNSGLYPFYEHDIHEQLMAKYISLPRLLKENGYATYGAGKIHHGPKGNSQEWTEYAETNGGKKKFAEGYKIGKGGKMSFRPTLHADKDHVDHQVASFGVEKLQEKHDKPFFLAVGIVKPHLPFDAPKRFFDALPEKIEAPKILKTDLNDIPKEPNSFRKVGDDRRFKADNAWEDVRRSYLACISWADYNIGRVLDALEKSEYADNTVVVLWTDHGYHLGEKMTFRKFTLWEEATKVPFIIYDTRNKSLNKNVTNSVSLINIYRTLAEMTGIEAPKYVDGKSLVPLLTNPMTKFDYPTITSWGQGNYSVRTEDYRYSRYFDGTEELYNHVKDENEWENLAKNDSYDHKKKELAHFLPTSELPMIMEYVAPWSVVGAGRHLVKGAPKQSKKDKKKK